MKKEEYEHIKIEATNYIFDRDKHTFGKEKIVRTSTEKKSFSESNIKNIENIISNAKSIKELMNYNDNNLIFCIHLKKDAYLKSIEEDLNNRDIDIISSYKNSTGIQIIVINKSNLDKLKKYIISYGNEINKYENINYIDSIVPITKEEKLGHSLKEKKLINYEYVNIELWLDKYSQDEFNEKITIIKNNIKDKNCRISDSFLCKSFAILRAYINNNTLEKIIDFPYIAFIDRPNYSYINIREYNNIDIQQLNIEEPPHNATGILIIDSGIVSNHPLLEKCVGDENNFQNNEKEEIDKAGHGTSVAGCVAYGYIKECIDNKCFRPSNYVFSAKVMYAEEDPKGKLHAKYDPEKLLEHQFYKAIEDFLNNNSNNIKCVNISIGDSDDRYNDIKSKQFPLAALIDELALKYNKTVFVISSGNKDPREIYDSISDIKNNYPKYLLESDFKIINPSTSALSITVGSISDEITIHKDEYNDYYVAEKIKDPIATKNHPSIFSRTGDPINDTIKPELVDYGGNMILYYENGRICEDIGGKLILLNNNVDKLFKYDYGTSFAAAKVSHIVGKIANKFSNASSNFIRNILLSGADYPDFYTDEKDLIGNFKKITGYGLPNYERSINSYNNRVLLYDESSIKIDNFKIYTINLPDIFFNTKGNKKIIITLTYNPETRKTRLEYFSNKMKCYLYHSIDSKIIFEKMRKKEKNKKKYKNDNEKINDNITNNDIDNYEIKINDKTKISNGCNQKYVIEYTDRKKNIPSSPIHIVLVNENKWLKDIEFEQDYCISIIFEHQEEIDLYNQIKLQNRVRTKIKY